MHPVRPAPRPLLFGLAALLLPWAPLGCASKPPAGSEPQTPAAPVTRAQARARPAARPRYHRRELPRGQVQFDLEKADLETAVLPLFLQQVGVKIHYDGPPRVIRSLHLSAPTPWRAAMDLVCEYTNTHLTRDYRGQWVLKDGWDGELSNGRLAGDDRPLGDDARGGTGRVSSGGEGRSGSGSGSSSGYDDGHAAARSTLRRVINGTSTTQAGR